MKKYRKIIAKVALCSATFCVLTYGLAVTYFPKEIVEWKVGRLEAALKEANPGWEGRIALADVGTNGHEIIAIRLSGSGLSDVTPLEGMSLTQLILDNTRVGDLLPLKGMPLKTLSVCYDRTRCLAEDMWHDDLFIKDLTPLAGMPLVRLWLRNSDVSDLTPLIGMPLTEVALDGTKVSNIWSLEGMPLKILHLNDTMVSDLTPLLESQLKSLQIVGTQAETEVLPPWLDKEIVLRSVDLISR